MNFPSDLPLLMAVLSLVILILLETGGFGLALEWWFVVAVGAAFLSVVLDFVFRWWGRRLDRREPAPEVGGDFGEDVGDEGR